MFAFSLITAVFILRNPTSTVPSGSVLATGMPSMLNRPAPNVEMRALDNSVVHLADYQGKVVFLNFWWSGCPPCVEELPALEAFAQSQAENNVLVVSVNNVDTPEQIQAFLTDKGITLDRVQVVRDVVDTSYMATKSLGVSVYPTTYVIDADQIIKKVKFGMLTAEIMDAFLADVRQSIS